MAPSQQFLILFSRKIFSQILPRNIIYIFQELTMCMLYLIMRLRRFFLHENKGQQEKSSIPASDFS